MALLPPYRSLPCLLCTPTHALQGHHPAALEHAASGSKGLDEHLKEVKLRIAKKLMSLLVTAKASS